LGGEVINKLDPHLRTRFTSRRTQAGQGATKDIPAAESEVTELLVEFRGDLADLKAVGFVPRSLIEHPTGGYKIVTGTLPVTRLGDLAAIEHVVEVEGPHQFHPMLDYSVPEIHADVLHNGSPSRKGAGVVIGIIDSGIDWRHRDFIGFDDRTSRILAIWDQMLTPGAGETAGPGGVGVEYLQAQISSAIQGTATIRTQDKDARGKTSGHGTHVSGIAAGDGSSATCCHGSNTFIGVAPSADLIVVRYDYTHDEIGANIRLSDGLSYIFNHPAAAGKPVVINISQGANRGPHDGTSLTERAINAIVAASAGRAVVVAAGNAAVLDPAYLQTLCHVKNTVGANGQSKIDFQLREGFESTAYLDLWYDRAGTLNIEVVADGGATSGVVNHGTSKSFPANPTASADHKFNVDIVGTINGNFGRDNNFRITINKPAKGNIPKGSWQLKLTNPNASAVNLHCWIERGDNGPIFLPPVDPPDGKVRASIDSTLTVPSTASGAITVANHATKTWCLDCWPSTDIVASSSRGPVARDAANNPKPDIAAPGLDITAAEADAANLPGNCCSCCPDACCCLYQDMTGTSMAAPHVTGTIALMLEANPKLTRDAILKALQDSATPPPAGGTKETWGAGKLNAQAAVNKVLAAGGGGPTPHMPLMAASDQLSSDSRIGLDWPEHKTWTHSSLSMAVDEKLHRIPPAIRIIRARVEALPCGLQLAATISRHFSEARRLVNTNRKIATMWHRCDGPRMLRRLFHGALDPEAPATLQTESHREYCERWLDLLAQHGSSALQASIAQYRELLLQFLELPLAAALESQIEVVC
jgi:subtilisin family serine protease